METDWLSSMRNRHQAPYSRVHLITVVKELSNSLTCSHVKSGNFVLPNLKAIKIGC